MKEVGTIIIIMILALMATCLAGCTTHEEPQASSSISPLLSTSTQPIHTTIQTTVPTVTKTSIPTSVSTRPTTKVTTPTPKPTTVAPASPICDCSGDRYNCADFPLSNKATAYSCYNYCMSLGRGDIHRLDRDGDGKMCE